MQPQARAAETPDPAPAPSGRCAFPLVLLCCAVYFTSYLTRKGYDASILAICGETGLLRTDAGLASTAAVTLYGFGQFATGFLADRFDSRKIVFCALFLTAACNAAMPFAAGAACVAAMVPLWAVNGFAQAMFWPPLVKIVAANLSEKHYKSAVFWISVAADAAIIVVFVLVSGCVRFAGWRLSFALVSASALAMAALWALSIRSLAPVSGIASPRAPGPCKSSSGPAASSGVSLPGLLAAAGLVPAMAAIACHGVMRDGIEVWAPSIVKDQYGLGVSGSIFSVALLPVFAVASMAAARGLRRVMGCEIKAASALFAAAFACAGFLFASNGAGLAAGLPVLAVLSACMHGANLLLIAELPGRFVRFGRVGALSGILNAFTYVGAAVSIYGFAAIREHSSGWRPVFGLWMAVLVLAFVLCRLAARRFAAFSERAMKDC